MGQGGLLMKTILWLLMGFAGALPVFLAAGALLYYLGLRDKLFAERNIFTAGGMYKGLWRSARDGKKRNFVETCERIVALEYKRLAEHPEEAAEQDGGDTGVEVEEITV